MWKVVNKENKEKKSGGKIVFSKREHPQVMKKISNFLPSERDASYPCTIGQIH